MWILGLKGLNKARGQFNKTFTSVIYKLSHCFQTLKHWLHLYITLVQVLLNIDQWRLMTLDNNIQFDKHYILPFVTIIFTDW